MKHSLGLGVILTLALTVSAQAQQALPLDKLLPAGSGLQAARSCNCSGF